MNQVKIFCGSNVILEIEINAYLKNNPTQILCGLHPLPKDKHSDPSIIAVFHIPLTTTTL